MPRSPAQCDSSGFWEEVRGLWPAEWGVQAMPSVWEHRGSCQQGPGLQGQGGFLAFDQAAGQEPRHWRESQLCCCCSCVTLRVTGHISELQFVGENSFSFK